MSPNLELVLEFLTHLYDCGYSYSAINSARSALSTVVIINDKPVGMHPFVIRLLKGIFNLRPSLPKTNVSWDPEIVLNYLKTLSPVKKLALKDLTLKTVTLLWLLSGQRGQSVQLIDVRNVTVTAHVVKLHFGDIMKVTRPGFEQYEDTIKAYTPDRRLCLVTVLREYLVRLKNLRAATTTQLFVSFNQPHDAVSKETVSRWVKIVMQRSGLDTSIFTPHSIRSASTSAAARANVPINTILQTAGWSKESTFAKYYQKPVKVNDYSKKLIETQTKEK